MMKKGYLILALLCCSTLLLKGQTLISGTFIRSYDFTQIDSLYNANGIPPSILEIDYEVDVYKIVYHAIDAHGDSTIASGAIAIPKNYTCAMPMSSYQHGTVYHNDNVPSRLEEGSVVIGVLFGTSGYIVAMPDYLGLGDGPGMHPYIHSQSAANAVVNMLRASYELCDQLNRAYSGELFLFGYSEGGHATMAAHKEIQEFHSGEFTVTASAPMSGPYDVSGVQQQVITANNTYPAPEYMPYVIFGLQEAYGNLYDSVHHVFLSPYDTILPPLYDGTHTGSEIFAVMPSVPNQVLLPSVLDSFNQNPNHPLRVALRGQDLYDWVPTSPMRMIYCEGDAHVSYMNAIVTLDTMLALGATDVEAVSAGAALSHGDCALYAMLSGKGFFDGFRMLDNGMNLTSSLTNETTNGAADGTINITLSGLTAPYTFVWSTGAITEDISGLAAGTYFVLIEDALGCSKTYLFTIGVLTGLSDDQLAYDLEVYPNPATSIVNFELPDGVHMQRVSLFDVNGRMVQTIPNIQSNKVTISTENLGAGMYFYTIDVAGGQVHGKVVFK
jgi:hypothetical protein